MSVKFGCLLLLLMLVNMTSGFSRSWRNSRYSLSNRMSSAERQLRTANQRILSNTNIIRALRLSLLRLQIRTSQQVRSLHLQINDLEQTGPRPSNRTTPSPLIASTSPPVPVEGTTTTDVPVSCPNCVEKVRVNQDINLGELALSPTAHNVRGRVILLTNRTLVIDGFFYDGQGPDAHFYYGRSGSTPSSSGSPLPDEKGSFDKLGEYLNKTIMITIPERINVDNIRWISVWCVAFDVDFGHVVVPSSLKVTLGPQIIGAFSQLAHQVRSGPVKVLNSKQIMIPGLFYDGLGPAAYFWVGNGTQPTNEGRIIPDETGSTGLLKAYTGQTIVLTLPGCLKVNQIGHLSIWCEKFEVNFGHVVIPKDLNIPCYRSSPRSPKYSPGSRATPDTSPDTSPDTT